MFYWFPCLVNNKHSKHRTSDQARSPCQGWQDHITWGDLPPFLEDQRISDHWLLLPTQWAQGRGDENPSGAEDDISRTAQSVCLLRSSRWPERTHRVGCQVCQGSRHCNQRWHHLRQDEHGASATRLLGKSHWFATHNANEGARQMWFSALPFDPRSPRKWHRWFTSVQEDDAAVWHHWRVHLLDRSHAHER